MCTLLPSVCCLLVPVSIFSLRVDFPASFSELTPADKTKLLKDLLAQPASVPHVLARLLLGLQVWMPCWCCLWALFPSAR